MTSPTPNAYPTLSAPLEDYAGPDVDQLEEEPAAGTPVRELAAAPEPAAGQKLRGRVARVVLEGPDGEELAPFDVRIDNRDYLAWDRTAPKRKWVGKRDDALPAFLMATFLAWNAAQRRGLTSLTFDQFQAAAVDVEELKADEADEARPTQ